MTKLKIWCFVFWVCLTTITVTFLYGTIWGADGPSITKQSRTQDGHALITVYNPLPKPAWVWFECRNALSKDPIGVLSKHSVTIDLQASEPISPEPCLIWHWQVQEGHSL